jgi:hypothetical protein
MHLKIMFDGERLAQPAGRLPITSPLQTSPCCSARPGVWVPERLLSPPIAYNARGESLSQLGMDLKTSPGINVTTSVTVAARKLDRVT